MPLATGNVKLQLRRVISRFKFDELEAAVLPSFPELTWQKLRSSLIKHHENFTVPASIGIIEQTIKDAGIGDKDLKDRLSTLQLMDVSRHSNRKVWTCHELRGLKTVVGFQSDREIQKNVSEAFIINVKRFDVRVTSHDNITFISVKNPDVGDQRKQRVYPIFFAFFKGEKYFFTSRKSIAKDYLLAITQGLGYTENKLAKLSGKDLKSLIELLQAKQQGTINNENIPEPPAYTEFKPVVSNTGIDFTQSKQKGEYLDKCFGTKPPKTEMLAVNIINQSWKCSELVPEVEDETVDIKLEFHGHHIPNMMKELAQRRVLQFPLPVYAERMLIVGRNEMTLRS